MIDIGNGIYEAVTRIIIEENRKAITVEYHEGTLSMDGNEFVKDKTKYMKYFCIIEEDYDEISKGEITKEIIEQEWLPKFKNGELMSQKPTSCPGLNFGP